MHPDLKDPLVERLIGPGKAFELETVDVFGRPQSVFKGAPRTLCAIYEQARRFGPRAMVVQDDVELTFDEVFAQAAALGKAFRERFGVKLGTKVAVVTSNRPEWLVSLIAITAAGGVAALVNSRGVAEEMLRAIATAQCELVILDAGRADIIAAASPDPPWPRIVIGPAATPLRAGIDADYATLAEPSPGLAFEPMAVAPSDGAIILFTSGTTGFPKGAVLSHGALAHGAKLSEMMGALQDMRYEEELGVKLAPDRLSMTSPAVILGPMFHLSGMLPSVRAISVGATIHIMSKWNVDVAFDLIERIGLSRLGFVPTMLWDMLRSPRAGPSTLGAIQYMVNGGASLNPALVAEIRSQMPRCIICNTYGQTEMTAWTCSISGATYVENPDSCGWAVPTVNLQIRREDGSQADVGERGELWTSSALLMTEYIGNPEATAEALRDGWCASGDIAFMDEAGLVTIVDRKKNMVISGGENIYCAEVERVLFEHPGVREVVAYGRPDARLGERLVVSVVPEPGAELAEEDLKAYCRQHLAIYKVPREIHVRTEALAKTASGKIDRGVFANRPA